jgi:hypothetical protein
MQTQPTQAQMISMLQAAGATVVLNADGWTYSVSKNGTVIYPKVYFVYSGSWEGAASAVYVYDRTGAIGSTDFNNTFYSSVVG